MILVVLGTQDKQFPRLLKKIDEMIDSKIITDKVVVQAGNTKYSSDKMEIFDFIPMDKFRDLVDTADLLITHGGVGTILDGLRKGKKIIAVPRLACYGEHVNDHQVQIIFEFSQAGYIIGCKSVDDLDKAFSSLENFVPVAYSSSNEKMIEIIKNFIN